jgi:hypothetical protein
MQAIQALAQKQRYSALLARMHHLQNQLTSTANKKMRVQIISRQLFVLQAALPV